MPIWKITSEGPAKVAETKLKQEKLLEEKLEDWVISDPMLLGEPLLIVGRQVIIPDVKARLDVLALDPQGNAVVIELKREELSDPVDIQALRYASDISQWQFEDFENQARNYLGKVGDTGFNFNEVYEAFCAEAGVDDVPDLNTDQRIIMVGAEIRERLSNVTLWLRNHSIDIKAIEVAVYRESDTLFIQPNQIVPLPTAKLKGPISRSGGGAPRPWINDGRIWHLEKRCSPTTKSMLLRLDGFIQNAFDGIDGPRWNQKLYVAYRIGNYNWLAIGTQATVLILDLNVRVGAFDQSDLAKRLGVEEFDKGHSLADKLGLPSSITVQNSTETRDRIRLRVKEDFALDGEPFFEFLKEAYAAFPK